MTLVLQEEEVEQLQSWCVEPEDSVCLALGWAFLMDQLPSTGVGQAPPYADSVEMASPCRVEVELPRLQMWGEVVRRGGGLVRGDGQGPPPQT